MKIKARKFNEESDIIESANGFNIVDDNGKTLFSIMMEGDASIRVDGGDTNFIDGQIYNGNFTIQPIAFNCVHLIKNKHD